MPLGWLVTTDDVRHVATEIAHQRGSDSSAERPTRLLSHGI